MNVGKPGNGIAAGSVKNKPVPGSGFIAYKIAIRYVNILVDEITILCIDTGVLYEYNKSS